MIKKMYKYVQIKRFHYDSWIQVYMDAFVYVDTDKTEEEEYLPDTKFVVVNYKRRSAPESVPTHIFNQSSRIGLIASSKQIPSPTIRAQYAAQQVNP